MADHRFSAAMLALALVASTLGCARGAATPGVVDCAVDETFAPEQKAAIHVGAAKWTVATTGSFVCYWREVRHEDAVAPHENGHLVYRNEAPDKTHPQTIGRTIYAVENDGANVRDLIYLRRDRPVDGVLVPLTDDELVHLATHETMHALGVRQHVPDSEPSVLHASRIDYVDPTDLDVRLVFEAWNRVGETRAESWSRAERPRVDKHPLQAKLRWEAA